MKEIEKGLEDIREGRTTPCDEKFMKTLEWMIENGKEGVPFDKEIPEEFQGLL